MSDEQIKHGSKLSENTTDIPTRNRVKQSVSLAVLLLQAKVKIKVMNGITICPPY